AGSLATASTAPRTACTSPARPRPRAASSAAGPTRSAPPTRRPRRRPRPRTSDACGAPLGTVDPARRLPRWHARRRSARDMLRRLRVAIALAGLGLSARAPAGGSKPAGGSDAGVAGTLSIATAARELVVLNGVPAHATFTATLTSPDGTRDVTADTRFTV